MTKRDHHHQSHNRPTTPMDPKGKMATIADARDDELLAALGYKVRTSSMADVAQKLEHLEMAMSMGTANDTNAAILSHLSSDAVHYNPSDLSSWLESMLSELNVPPIPASDPVESSSTTVDRHDDLSAIIPAGLVDPDTREKKRIRSTASSSSDPVSVVLVDSQETGIKLVHALLACAEAVQQENLPAAEALVKQVGVLAMSQGGAMRKVATYFAEALARRIYRIYPNHDAALEGAFSDMLQMHFYEACPYLKFAHFTANQAILEAFAGKSKVHIVDFSMKQGQQWPPLMQALALRPGGAPSFRLTGIGPPQPDSSDALQQVGLKLAQFAETLHVEFEYRGFVARSLADLEPYMFDMGRRSSSSSPSSTSSSSSEEEREAVAVNSVFELHGLLGQPGSIEKVLGTMKSLRPSIVTVVEQEANHNGPIFLDRFTEALHYYSSMFDSLEGGCGGVVDSQDQVMTEVYLGRQICNVVACEGPERTERHETMGQWRRRMADGGFVPLLLGSNAFKQASMLLELFAGGEGYRVEEKEGCLLLGWHTRPLITTSAWRLASSQPSIHAVGSHRHRP